MAVVPPGRPSRTQTWSRGVPGPDGARLGTGEGHVESWTGVPAGRMPSLLPWPPGLLLLQRATEEEGRPGEASRCTRTQEMAASAAARDRTSCRTASSLLDAHGRPADTAGEQHRRDHAGEARQLHFHAQSPLLRGTPEEAGCTLALRASMLSPPPGERPGQRAGAARPCSGFRRGDGFGAEFAAPRARRAGPGAGARAAAAVASASAAIASATRGRGGSAARALRRWRRASSSPPSAFGLLEE